MKSFVLSLLLVIISLPFQETILWGQLPGKEVNNVVLIGWDGAGRLRVKEAMDKGDLPYLAELSHEGKAVNIDAIGFTDTKAGWTEILTGYGPNNTLIYNNYSTGSIPEGYTIFERLEDYYGRDNISTAAFLSEKFHLEKHPPLKSTREITPQIFAKMRKKAYAAMQEKGIEKGEVEINVNLDTEIIDDAGVFYNAGFKADIFQNGIFDDARAARLAEKFIDENSDKTFFLFVLFDKVDNAGARYGENSAEYMSALIETDHNSGKIIEKLKQIGIYDKTLIYVTSDHGVTENTNNHIVSPYVFLCTNDEGVVARGTRPDIGATILNRFGIQIDQIDPPLDGRTLLKRREDEIWG